MAILAGASSRAYVHWVMHKCIMVKVGGKRNTHKVCKKQVNFSKTGWGNFKMKGGNNNFRKTGWGKCTETGKIGREIRNLWSMTKKGHQKFWRMKIFSGTDKNFQQSLKMFRK